MTYLESIFVHECLIVVIKGLPMPNRESILDIYYMIAVIEGSKVASIGFL